MSYSRSKRIELFNEIMEDFQSMKKKIILAMKKDLVDLDITANQLRIIEYMLKGKNWMKTKTALCKELGCSRPTLLLCEDILKTYYKEKYGEE